MRRSERIARLLVVPLAVSFGVLLLVRPDAGSRESEVVVVPGTTSTVGRERTSPTTSPEPELGVLPAADPVAPVAEPVGILSDDGLLLVGSVPDEATAASYLRRLAPVIGPEDVTVQLTVDDRVTADTLPIELVPSLPSPADAASVESLVTTSTTILDGFPDSSVVLTGHTDAVGTVATNLALSTAQAQLVADALVERGTDPERIDVRGAGESQPVAPNDTADGRRANQRVAVSFEGIGPG